MRQIRALLFGIFGLPEDGPVRFKWMGPGPQLTVIIEKPVGPHSWSRKTYRCSVKSVLRLYKLAKRYPAKFESYF